MQVIFSDFDGTLTLDGKITSHFFSLMDLLKSKKMELVIVTGRSISWAHFLLTHSNVKLVIAEGGGCYSWLDSQGRLQDQILVEPSELNKLQEFTTYLKSKISAHFFSRDNQGRLTDRALEYLLMDSKELDKVYQELANHQISYSLSNVHLNYWIGDISKANAIDFIVKKNYKNQEVVYFGDSLNDQSVFAAYQNTIGVSNISKFLTQLKFPPKHILEGANNREILGVLNWIKNNF